MNLRGLFHNTIDILFSYSNYISSILLIILAVIDISDLDKYKIFYWTSVFLAVLFGLMNISNTKNITEIEKIKEEQSNKIIDLESALNDSIQEMNDLFNSYLMLLSKNLDFTHTERISVYKVFDDRFILIGRYSNNPKLNKNGRSHYPLEEGFIGKGWTQGEFFIDDMPDSTSRNGDNYFKKITEFCSIDKTIIDKMNMKSRSYFIRRINGYDERPKAILVIESLNEKGIKKENIIDKLQGVEKPLVMFIEKNNGIKLQKNTLGL